MKEEISQVVFIIHKIQAWLQISKGTSGNKLNKAKSPFEHVKVRPCVPIESFCYNRLIVIIFAYFNCKNNCYNCIIKAYQKY